MIFAKRNQLHNVNNSAQGEAKRVLTVCSASLLRSPTIANYLHLTYGYNTRSCGTSKEYALIPISEALITWADLIVFANVENYQQLDQEEKDCIAENGTEVLILDLDDVHEWNSKELVDSIAYQFKHKYVDVHLRRYIAQTSKGELQ